MVIALVKSITNGPFPGRISTTQANVLPDAEYDLTTSDLAAAFPNCKMLGWLQSHTFWIKRHLYEVGNKRTVHFVVSPARQQRDFTQKNQFNTWLDRFGSWFAYATCINGQITYVKSASRVHTRIGYSAKRCGFGSYVAHLCFLNIEHHQFNPTLFSPEGYNIDTDPRFSEGNMASIRFGLIDNYCSRITYVRFISKVDENDKEHGIDMRRGSKAFIYAAFAARYTHMITYIKNPCKSECCSDPNNPAMPDPAMGKVFWLQGIISSFNVQQPIHFYKPTNRPGTQNLEYYEPKFLQTELFAQHNGRDWFFAGELHSFGHCRIVI